MGVPYDRPVLQILAILKGLQLEYADNPRNQALALLERLHEIGDPRRSPFFDPSTWRFLSAIVLLLESLADEVEARHSNEGPLMAEPSGFEDELRAHVFEMMPAAEVALLKCWWRWEAV